VPLLLSWGERDTERVRRSNERAVGLLAEKQKHYVARCYPGLDHFQTQLALGDPAHDWYAALREMRDRG